MVVVVVVVILRVLQSLLIPANVVHGLLLATITGRRPYLCKLANGVSPNHLSVIVAGDRP